MKICILILSFVIGILGEVSTAWASESTNWDWSSAHGKILYFKDHNTAIVRTSSMLWEVGEVVAVHSQNAEVGVIGFLEVTSFEKSLTGDYEIKAKLIKGSRNHFIQAGDVVFKLDLTGDNETYLGTSELIIQSSDRNVASRYRPLVFQGLLIGETAQTLWKQETLLTWYGDISYGVTDHLSVRTLIPANVYGAYNLKAKYKTYDSSATTVSLGASINTIPEGNSTTLNFDVYWDSISSESTISHTFVTIALASFEKADETTAVKSLGTSSIQSGYEIIMSDWSRFLLGPVYNFEKKALGGYVSYLKIWNRFHLSFTLSSTNVAELKVSAQDGYYGLIDAFWRF